MSDEEKKAAEKDDEDDEKDELNEDVATQITPGNVLMNVLDSAESKEDWDATVKKFEKDKEKLSKDV